MKSRLDEACMLINKAAFWYAHQILLDLALSGNAAAQFLLGWMYYNGKIGAIDYYESAKWYKKAALQGAAAAECCIGYMYRYGQGVEKNDNLALDYLQSAADKGYVPAFYLLARQYAIKQEYDKAVNWYCKSAEKGDPNETYFLAYALEKGRGVPQNRVKALQLYQKAAKNNHSEAEKKYRILRQNLLYHNEITSNDFLTETTNESNETKCSDALYYQAYELEIGKNVPQDEIKALQLYLTAARQKHIEAKKKYASLRSKLLYHNKIYSNDYPDPNML